MTGQAVLEVYDHGYALIRVILVTRYEQDGTKWHLAESHSAGRAQRRL